MKLIVNRFKLRSKIVWQVLSETNGINKFLLEHMNRRRKN